MTMAIMTIGIYVPFSLYGQSIGLVPLPLSYFPWLVGILICYCLLAQSMKNWFIGRYGFN
jgi:Mg2+-importing ATPase